jgi:hypothetical protein
MIRSGVLTITMTLVTIVASTADDTQPASPATAAVEPVLLPSVESAYATELTKGDAVLTKAETEVTKLRKSAAETRLKAYRDRLVEVTKAGDFDKAIALKVRITELENEPEQEPAKAAKRPRPKGTVRFGGHAYAVIKEPATWHLAKQRCEEMGGHLVCINSRNEEEFVQRHCGSNNTWIGASDEETEGTWINVDRTPSVLTKTEINNGLGLEHWLFWNGKAFEDYPSGARIGYLCEWDR